MDEENKRMEEKPQPDDQQATVGGQQAVVSNQQQTTNNEQPPTQNMEAHTHVHHSPRKKFGHYFYEFLMLFLAVFCGFLAEYFLEHKIEKERGKQFIESFYEDLKTDTARIIFYTRFDDEKIKSLVNLENCYDAVLKNMNDADCLMEVIKHTAINRPFMRTDRTLKQLANAGGFRLLKKEDADSILSYDVTFNNFQDFQSTIFQEAQDNVRNTFNALGNFRANAQMFRPVEGKIISTGSFIKEDVTAPLLFSGDKNVLNKYFNELQLYYRVTYNHKRMLLGLKDKQAQLIEHLKNKYHFD